MGGFNNPVVGALKLIRRAIQSPNYQAGTVGWTINDDGSAEFNALTVRGKIVVQSSTQGIFVYSGTPALGNLLASISAIGGTDPYGNTYSDGITSYNGQYRWAQLQTGGLLFHDAGWVLDAEILAITDDAPDLFISSPTADPGGLARSQIDLKGRTADGTIGPYIRMTGITGSATEIPIPVQINGDLTVSGIGQVRYATAIGGQAVTNSSTLQDDTALTMSVTAGAVYDVEVWAYFHCNSATPGLLTSWSVPTGSTGLKACVGSTNVAAGYTSTSQTQSRYTARTPTTNSTYQLDGSGNDQVVIERSILTAGANGNVTFRWAQSTATVGATTQRDSSSFMKVTRVS